MLGRYPQAFELVWQASPRHALMVTTLTLIGALTIPAQIWLTKVLLDRIGTVGPDPQNWGPLLLPITAFVLTLVISDVSASLRSSLRDVLQMHVSNHVRSLVLQKAVSLDLAFFETPALHDRLENVLRDVWRTQNLPWILLDTTGAVLSLVVTCGLLVPLHPLAVPLLVVLVIPQLVARARYTNLEFTLWNRRGPTQRMASYVQTLLTQGDAVKEVRLFGLGPWFLHRFRAANREVADEYGSRLLAQERWNLLTTLLAVTGLGLVWIYAVWQAVSGRITLGDLLLVFQASEQVRTNLSHFVDSIGVFYEHSLYVGELHEFLALEPDDVPGALTPRPVGEGPSPMVRRPLQQGVEFRGVSFAYPGADRPVLEDVSFTIPAGTSMALVGENGAGKTTLVKLLARLYEPTAGCILLDGRDIREYEPAELHRAIGVVFQDFVRYHLTARENIGLGRIEHLHDRARIRAAAEASGALPLLEKLPFGAETLLGRTFEGSVELSGGEWQKLALARAFIRDAQVLILDEPTAALDPLAEHEVFQRFAELTAGKTTLFVSHRFSTVKMARSILVLENGRVLEQGSHDELMARDGQYARMFRTQAKQYL